MYCLFEKTKINKKEGVGWPIFLTSHIRRIWRHSLSFAKFLERDNVRKKIIRKSEQTGNCEMVSEMHLNCLINLSYRCCSERTLECEAGHHFNEVLSQQIRLCGYWIDWIGDWPNGFRSTFTENKTVWIDQKQDDQIDQKKFPTWFPKQLWASSQTNVINVIHAIW